MNKRLLGGLAAAGIIGGGVYGFAATLDLTTDNLAANTKPVTACDDDGGVDVDYTVKWATDKYVVDEVTVRGIDIATGGCLDDTLAVTLATGTNVQKGEVVLADIDGSTEVLSFLSQNVSAQEIENVHVAIAGGDS